jgi:hypothetical protein
MIEFAAGTQFILSRPLCIECKKGKTQDVEEAQSLPFDIEKILAAIESLRKEVAAYHEDTKARLNSGEKETPPCRGILPTGIWPTCEYLSPVE